MNLGRITVITPPDKLFNLTTSYLLIKPSVEIKQQFQIILSKSFDDTNIFVFDQNETDIDWMLSVANHADTVIIDVDNCDYITRQFVTYLLAYPHVYYITNDELTPYNLISKNRIYDLEAIAAQFNDIDEEDQEDNDE